MKGERWKREGRRMEERRTSKRVVAGGGSYMIEKVE